MPNARRYGKPSSYGRPVPANRPPVRTKRPPVYLDRFRLDPKAVATHVAERFAKAQLQHPERDVEELRLFEDGNVCIVFVDGGRILIRHDWRKEDEYA